MSTLIAAWRLFKWVRKQRRDMEANAEAYLSDERALEWRREAERIFIALKDGDSSTMNEEGTIRRLPKPIVWFFKRTEADNHLGRFGQTFLKSSRLSVYRTH